MEIHVFIEKGGISINKNKNKKINKKVVRVILSTIKSGMNLVGF